MGSYLAASMWIYTKAVFCEGRKLDPPLDLQPILAIIVESVSRVIEDSVGPRMDGDEGHHERKSHSGGTSLRHGRALPIAVGTIVALSTDKPHSQVREQRNKSGQIQGQSQQFELTCSIACDGAHTLRACFLRAVTIFLCYAPDRDWNLEEEMQGWGRGGTLTRKVFRCTWKRGTCNEC